jgi:hypothetical protein
MPNYTATLAYNAPFYADVEFEAASDEEAIEIAKRMAMDCDGNYNGHIEWAEQHRVVDLVDENDDYIAEDVYV